MLVAFDTNIVIYAAGLNDRIRFEQALAVRTTLGPDRTVIATQVIGEFFHALVTKFKKDRLEAQWACQRLGDSALTASASQTVFADAIDLASRHRLQIWDALILFTAAAAGCVALLSENMQHGFVHRGVTVINPFAEPMHPLLADALRHPPR